MKQTTLTTMAAASFALIASQAYADDKENVQCVLDYSHDGYEAMDTVWMANEDECLSLAQRRLFKHESGRGDMYLEVIADGTLKSSYICRRNNSAEATCIEFD